MVCYSADLAFMYVLHYIYHNPCILQCFHVIFFFWRLWWWLQWYDLLAKGLLWAVLLCRRLSLVICKCTALQWPLCGIWLQPNPVPIDPLHRQLAPSAETILEKAFLARVRRFSCTWSWQNINSILQQSQRMIHTLTFSSVTALFSLQSQRNLQRIEYVKQWN
jgi:hypothetical protein